MRTIRPFAFALLFLSSAGAIGGEHSPLEAFPEAQSGMSRYVIHLPEMRRAEAHYSVELVAGRVIRTDGVNQVRMDATLEARPLQGWGYTYYQMTGTGQVASTLMAPPPGAEPVDAFVHGSPLTLPYNGRLPIVVYAPVGFEIRYRIWAAAEEYLSASEG
jgi:ecotin